MWKVARKALRWIFLFFFDEHALYCSYLGCLFLWGGYISKIYSESTQELDQILGPFWFVYTTESSQDFKKVQTNQTGPRIWKTSWALSGLILVCLHFFQILGTFCFVNRPERAQNLIEFLGTFWVNSANVATPLGKIRGMMKNCNTSLVFFSFCP